MGHLAFVHDDKLFDGECVRFRGMDGDAEVLCGVTAYALQDCDPALPKHGLIGAEAFLEAFDRLLIDIHQVARAKYQRGEFEPDSPVKIMIHRHDLSP